MGVMQDRVSPRWKYAAFVFGGLIVVQAIWWNSKAPEVLRLGY